MKALQEHMIGTQTGTWPLLEWATNLAGRRWTEFDPAKQLEWAKKIAGVDCPKSRKLLLALMAVAERQEAAIRDHYREFGTLCAALNKIDKNNP